MSWGLGVLLLSPGGRNATQISRANTNFFHRLLRRCWLRSHIREKTHKRISRWGDERRTFYLPMPSSSCVVSRCKKAWRRLSTMLTKVERTDNAMTYYASNQTMFLQPSKLQGAGDRGMEYKCSKWTFVTHWGKGLLTCYPLGSLDNFTLTLFFWVRWPMGTYVFTCPVACW